MKLFRTACLAALLAAPTFAAAVPFSIDFEKNWGDGSTDVDNYYNGGKASDGTSGPNRGVGFTNVAGLSNDPSFPPPLYANAPSPLGIAFPHAFFPTDVAVMNVAAGIGNAISFFYASPTAIVGAVRAFSGLDGTGTLLGTLSLTANSSTSYDTFTQTIFAFAGVARSFDFTNAANVIALDNIASVPEPGVVALVFAGAAAGLTWRTRRRGAAMRGLASA